MTLLVPTMATQALLELRDCVCEQLTTNGAGALCWCGLHPGALISWEGCGVECNSDACGMGWVRLATVFPYETFPEPAVQGRCTLPVAWAVEVGALRCLPMPDGLGLPDPEGYADATLRQALDAHALHAALACCTVETAIGAYTPVGPAGGCVGGYWNAVLAAD